MDVEQRQLCWAHLKRDLTAIAERDGVSKEIGSALLRRESRLFRALASGQGWNHESGAVTRSIYGIKSRI